MNLKLQEERLQVDVLLLSGNPRQKLRQIRECVDFKQLIIDNTNSDYKIQDWHAEAVNLNISCYVLKKSPAYIVKLL